MTCAPVSAATRTTPAGARERPRARGRDGVAPSGFCGHVRGIEHQPAALADERGIDALALGRRPAIHPDDGRCHRLAAVGRTDAAVELAADRKAGDIVGCNAGVGERLRDGGAQRRQPQGRVLLGPAGLREDRLVGGGTGAAKMKRIVDDDCLETLGANVDPKKHRQPPELLSLACSPPARP